MAREGMLFSTSLVLVLRKAKECGEISRLLYAWQRLCEKERLAFLRLGRLRLRIYDIEIRSIFFLSLEDEISELAASALAEFGTASFWARQYNRRARGANTALSGNR